MVGGVSMDPKIREKQKMYQSGMPEKAFGQAKISRSV